MVAGTAVVSRDFVVLEFRVFPGEKGEYPLSPGRKEKAELRSYAEWKRIGHRAYMAGDFRELPTSRWQRDRTRSAASVYGHGSDRAQKHVETW